MRKLRVAIVAPSLRILGGQSVQAQRLLDGWSQDPHVDAWLVPINPIPPGILEHLLRIKYVRTLVTQLMYWPQLVMELRHADVVHVFSASYLSFLLSPLPAILIARALRRPVILNYHSGAGPDHLKRSAVARAVSAGVDRVIVPSQFLVDAFSSFGIEAVAIPNHVDLKRFIYRRRDPVRPRILSVRNFEGLYNVACTLRAFALVQKRWPNAELTLVGSGSLDRELRALVETLKLERVTFAGRVPPASIAEYYAVNDIYIQSPDIDNMPVSILEAYASGLPVVSTRAGGVPAMLTHGEHGLLAPLDDHEALASHILYLLEEPGVAAQLAERALTACEAFQWERVRGDWLAHYRSLGRPQPQRVAADMPRELGSR